MYQVYVKADEQGRITEVNSSAFSTDFDGWTQIDAGDDWPKYMHAQSNYFPQPITTEEGVCRYKLVDGHATERTQAEIDADIPAPAPPQPELGDVVDIISALLTGVDE